MHHFVQSHLFPPTFLEHENCRCTTKYLWYAVWRYSHQTRLHRTMFIIRANPKHIIQWIAIRPHHWCCFECYSCCYCLQYWRKSSFQTHVRKTIYLFKNTWNFDDFRRIWKIWKYTIGYNWCSYHIFIDGTLYGFLYVKMWVSLKIVRFSSIFFYLLRFSFSKWYPVNAVISKFIRHRESS